MKRNAHVLALLLIGGLTATAPPGLCADAAASKEYRIKAAFLYNFVMFVDSKRFTPPPEGDAPQKPITIGIVGKDSFGGAFTALRHRGIRNRRVVVKRFRGLEAFRGADGQQAPRHPQLTAIRQCHVLFVSASERPHLKRILAPLRESPILTVGDTPAFLEAGGIINFVIEDKKVRFEINAGAARRAGLQVRARLLRLAKRVVKDDSSEEATDEGNETRNEDK